MATSVIRDDEDYARHVEYIHYNPVKHGYVEIVKDWKYSSFHRWVARGIYPMDWATNYNDEFGVCYE